MTKCVRRVLGCRRVDDDALVMERLNCDRVVILCRVSNHGSFLLHENATFPLSSLCCCDCDRRRCLFVSFFLMNQDEKGILFRHSSTCVRSSFSWSTKTFLQLGRI